MDMEIARLSNISWLQIPDRQAVAMRTVRQRPEHFRNRAWTQLARPVANDALPVPALDWPAALFQDDVVEH